ncbi:MAG: DNA-binding protein WhiA [Clostridiales bacterium]|nr:DNA-binding protein WhiA [Clostridiales bacterium]
MSAETPSGEIKKEILKSQYATDEEWAAEMAAICLCSGFSEEEDLVIVDCPKENVARRLCEDAKKSGRLLPSGEMKKVGRRGGSFYTVPFPKEAFLEFIEPFLMPDTIVEDISEKDEIRRAVLKGAFLARGSYSDPQKKNRVEILCKTDAFVKPLILLFHAENIQPSTRVSDTTWAIYFKKTDAISDFLVILGAMRHMMDLQNIKAQREVNRMVASTVNLDNWTMKQQADASARRTKQLEALLASEKAGRIPKELLDVARLHIDNPGLSLTELGKLMDPPISKSGMNHRLKKLIDML